MITVERDDKGLWIVVTYPDRTVVMGPLTNAQAGELAHALLTEVQDARVEDLRQKGLVQ